MADNFFKVHGAREIAAELEKLSRGAKNTVVRPGLRQAVAEIRKIAKQIAPKGETGALRKGIQSKVVTMKKGSKGVLGVVGMLKKDKVGKPSKKFPKGVPIQIYGGALNKKIKFLQRANQQGKGLAIQKLKSVTAEKIVQFQAKMDAKAKAKKK